MLLEVLFMRIMKGKSKDPTYHVIQDVRRNGKRSTEIIENLGHASEICSKYNVSNADEWANEYIQSLRNKAVLLYQRWYYGITGTMRCCRDYCTIIST